MKKFFTLLVLLFCITSSTVLAQGDPTAVTASIESSSNTRDFTDDACDPTNPQEGQDCYQLLESIPLQDNRVLDSIDTTASGGEEGIGGFLNFMFEIGIGIAGVLGVVMLVIYGFRYAANDKNINTFTRLKEKIGSVILGLLLLLGIFVILNTINPDLLVVEPGIADITLNIEGSDYDNAITSGTLGTGQVSITSRPSATCPSGHVAVATQSNIGVRYQRGKNLSVNICKDLLDQLIQLRRNVVARGIDIVITRTDKGEALSKCHKSGPLTCADIGLHPFSKTPAKFQILCEEIDKMPRLDFINEVSSLPKCGSKYFHKTPYASSDHFHVILK